MNDGRAYYNEIDPRAAQWLEQLIADGCITRGVVDRRSIAEVQPSDLVGFRRVHFFAGIGMWDFALDLAGWGDDEIWTGSCPCQPFSSAGKRNGAADERHLWPEYMRLIRACRPKFVIGEQVASADVLGSAGKRREGAAGPVWFDGIHADMETAHYACGALDLPAACVGSPNIRQRLWWGGYDRGLADSRSLGRGRREDDDHGWRRECTSTDCRQNGGVEQSSCERGATGVSGSQSREARNAGVADNSGREERPWSRFSLIHCTDGKVRRIPAESESVLQRVADGGSDGMDDGWPESLRIAQAAKGYPLAIKVPHRVALLRGYGNAINPYVAEVFIRAFARSVKFLRA